MNEYIGRCHCGAIGFTLATARRPSEWVVRSCQCGFCRSHGARTTSDPQANVRFNIADPSRLLRYRFATRSLEFLVCSGCGGYLGAVHRSERGAWATLNVNVMQPPPVVPAALPFVPDEVPDNASAPEKLAQKRTGREARWTPVTGTV